MLRVEDTRARFSLSDWRATDLTYRGASVLGDLEAGRVRVTAERKLYLPLVLR